MCAPFSTMPAVLQEVFPPCERLGAPLLQHHAALRTSGVLVAEIGTDVAGFLLFSRTADTGIIAKVAVAGAFQRQGVGDALLQQGIAELSGQTSRRRTPPAEIMLHVDPERVGARRLYESRGFVQEELLKKYYEGQRDAIVMRWRPHGEAARRPSVATAAARRLQKMHG